MAPGKGNPLSSLLKATNGNTKIEEQNGLGLRRTRFSFLFSQSSDMISVKFFLPQPTNHIGGDPMARVGYTRYLDNLT